MSLAYFERTFKPCILNEVISWHLAHGWVWNIIDRKSLRPIGVFYATLLCGDGVVLHFDTLPDVEIPFALTLSAMKRGIRLVEPHADLILATIPEVKHKLIQCAQKLGFRRISNFRRDNQAIVVLQFFPPPK